MKLDREELLKVLAAVRPGIAKKEIILQATHIIFTGDAVATYNDSICIIHPYETDFQCSVQGEEFYKALESINEKEVEIIVEEKQVRIKSRRTKAGLSTLVGEKEKVEGMIQNLREKTSVKRFWRKLPGDFVQGVFLCMFSTSKDMTKGVRCCVATRNNEIFSTDNLRLSKYVMNGSMDSVLIPSKTAVELVKYDLTRYGVSEGWTHFLTKDNVMFNCRTMAGDYPFDAINRFFRPPEEEIILPKELQDAMKAAAVFAAGDVDIAKMIEVKIKGNKITCKSEKERGWMEKELDVEGDVDDVVFYINPIFMAQILEKSTSLFLIQKEEFPDKAVFTNATFQHIVALPE